MGCDGVGAGSADACQHHKVGDGRDRDREPRQDLKPFGPRNELWLDPGGRDEHVEDNPAYAGHDHPYGGQATGRLPLGDS